MGIGAGRIGSSTAYDCIYGRNTTDRKYLAAMLGAIELPVGIVASLFFLNEAVHGVQWFGMLLILTGIVVAEKRKVS